MVPNMKAGGKTTRPTEKADSSMQMAISTRVSGSTIRHTASAYTAIWMEPSTRAIGRKTSSMAME